MTGTPAPAAMARSVPPRAAPIELRAAALIKSFSHPGRTVEVLRGVSLELRSGTTTVVTAAPRAGSTTLVRCLAATYRPDDGRLALASPPDELDLATASARAVAWVRRSTIAVDDGELIAPPRRSGRAVLERVARGAAGGTFGLELLGPAVAELGLDAIADEPVGRLGHTDRAMLATLATLLRGSPVVLLDQPFRAHPASSADRLAQLVNRARGFGAAVLVTVGAPPPFELTVDRHLHLSEGRITDDRS